MNLPARARSHVQPSARALGYGVVALAACGWGTWGVIIRHAERGGPLDSRVDASVVMVTITVVAFALLSVERRVSTFVREPPKIRGWLGVGWLGFSDAMNVLLLFAAYRHTSFAIAVTTHYLAPIFVAIASPLALRERAHAHTYVAVAIGLFGLVLLLRPWNEALSADDVFGAACGAGSAVFYASNVIVNKRLVRSFTAIELMAYHGVVAAPVLVALVPPAAWSALHAPAVLDLVVGGVGPGALGGILFVWGLRSVPAAHASTLTLLEPLVAVLLALVVGERLAPISWLGGALILGGAALVLRKPGAV